MIRCFIKRLLPLVLFFFSSVAAQAGKGVPVIQILDGSQDQLQVDSSAMVMDSAFFNPSYNSILVKPYRVLNYVTFKINEASPFYLQSDFKASIRLRITSTLANLSTAFVDTTLEINYKADSMYAAKSTYHFENAYKVEIAVLSVTTDAAWDVWNALMVENRLESFPVFTFSCTDNAIQSVSHEAIDYDTELDELSVSWPTVVEADKYDLEWTYIDSAAMVSGNYHTGGNPDPLKIFDNSATRVTTAATQYKIPLFYDGSGSLFYRVRPVQEPSHQLRIEANWSSGYASGLGRFDYTGHQRNLNWQSTISYAEDGKRKVVMQYFDGSLRSRQTVTKDNTSYTTIVAESIYDYQGRPAIQVLPAPTMENIVRYSQNFNIGLNGNAYDYTHFDEIIDSSYYCSASAEPMKIDSGAARYYSPENPLVDSGYHKFIANAMGYPFTETVYTQDNTGRISAQSGVGSDHRITSGRETKYFYGTPDQKELDALFGTDVGDYSHYFKTMVRDANGQYSVSYTDMHGRTIATALAGVLPEDIKLDSLKHRKTRMVTETLADSSNMVIKDLVIESTKSLVVSLAGDHVFSYNLDPKSLVRDDCNDIPVCYDCLYDLEISITDDCNNQKLGGHAFDTVLHNFTMVDTTCDNPAQGFSFNFTKFLPEGEYQITKKLSVNRYAMDYYRDSIFNRKNACTTEEEMINYRKQLEALVIQCKPSCESCIDSLGTWESFRDKYMLYGGISIEDSADYRMQAMQAYTAAESDCRLICDSITQTDQIYNAMLMDMTAPSGQYANLENAEDIYSVFYATYVGDNMTLAPAYQRASGYLDEEGNLDYIFDENAGVLVAPQDLSPEAFAQKFKLSWAKTLLPYHPEYCKLQKHLELEGANTWARRFEGAKTYSDALAKGYLNPVGIVGAAYTRFNGTVGLIDRDPAPGILGGSALSLFQNAMISYTATGVNSGTAANNIGNIWALASAMTKCAQRDNSCYTGKMVMDSAFANMCDADLDMAWLSFRQMYIDTRQHLIDSIFTNGVCSAAVKAEVLIAASHTPNFGGASAEVLEDYGITVPTNQSELTALEQQAKNQATGYSNSNCETYASYWFEQLSACTYYSPAVINNIIIPQLVAVCKKGTDLTHPYGSSTIAPDSTHTHSSFQEVIQAYNTANGITDIYCNAYSITAPKPYNAQVAAGNQPVTGLLDSCACSRVTEIYNKYQGVQSDYTNFSEYLKEAYNTDISQPILDSLRQRCAVINNPGACAGNSFDLSLPPLFQCNTGDVCITCEQYQSHYNSFTSMYPGIVPVADSLAADTTQLTKNRFFEQFMNHRLGFSKNLYEYLQFSATCTSRLETGSGANADTCSRVTFIKNYGGSGTEELFDIRQTTDGGYILAGSTSSFGRGGTDGYIIKTDKKGNVVWSRTYGGTANDDFMKVRQTTDGGYIAVGSTRSFHQAQGEIFVVKINSAGTVTWARGFANGTPNGEAGIDIIQTSEGGYAIAGLHNNTSGVLNLEVIKLTSTGGVSWARTFGSSNTDNLGGIVEIADTLYLGAFGYSSAFTKVGGGSPPFSSYDALLVKINKSNGNIFWAKVYDIANKSNWVSHIQATPSGVHLDVVNMTGWSGASAYNVSLQLDRNGNTIQSVRLSMDSLSGRHNFGSARTFDGGFISGWLRMDANADAMLQKVSATGTISWSRSFKKTGVQYFRQAMQNSDSSFAAVGKDGTNALFIRTNRTGETYCADSTLNLSRASLAVTTYDVVLTPVTITFSNPSISVTAQNATTVQTDVCGQDPCPSSNPCNNQTFSKTYGGSGTDALEDLRQTTDGGYILAGSTTSFGAGGTDAYVIKTDKKGNITWSKTYGGGLNDDFRKIKQTSDGGYIAIGTTRSFNQPQGETFVVKMKASGAVDWARRFGQATVYGERGFDIVQTSEGGYALVGLHNFTSGLVDLQVLKLNSAGNITWAKKIGASGKSDNLGGIIEFADTLVIGAFTQGASSKYDAVLVKMNKANGNIISAKTYNTGRSDWVNHITKTANGYQLDLTNSDTWNGGNPEASVLRIRRNGTVESHHQLVKPTGFTGIGSSAVTFDGGFIVSQLVTSGSYADPVIQKIDLSWGGNYKWQNIIKRPGVQYLTSVIQSADSSFAGVGVDQGSALFIKTNLQGKTNCNDSMAYNAPASGISVTTANLTWPSSNLTFSNTNISLSASDAATTQSDICSFDPCRVQGAGPVLCGRAEPLFPAVSLDSIDNCMDSTFFAVSSGKELFKVYKDSLNNNFDSSYRALCMQAYRYESFTVTHAQSEYHYTLYYYDQAGNLVRTVPPAGVDDSKFDWQQAWSDSVRIARTNRAQLKPDHFLKTDYRYNTLNQVVAQQTPDAGVSRFWYDRLGRLAISQNAKQQAASSEEEGSQYSYTLYDELGRITQVGQISNATANAMTDQISRSPVDMDNWLTASVVNKEQVTTTVYDLPYAGFTGLSPVPIVQRNLRNRVSYVSIAHGANPAQYNQASFYTYDALGNVDTLLQDYGASDITATQNVMNVNNNRFKRIVYRFDLIIGKVNSVAYQPNQADQFYHRYTYDAENRLILAETSIDSIHWEKDARYQYYRHGPLARTVLGEQQVQGLDYAYTLHGWLKGVNSSSLEIGYDMGRDGDTTWINRYVARDAFGFNLGYYTGDYSPINSAVTPFPGYSAYLSTAYKPLYNGNISSMVVNIGQFSNPMLYAYTYDQLNRLTGMDAHTGFNQATNSWSGLTATNDYGERVAYDPNGNITQYQRNGVSSVNLAMDNLTYNYNKDGSGRLLNNRLNYVQDAVGSGNYTMDIDNQNLNNYGYDEIGNLIKDHAESITDIKWNVYGKIQEIQRNATDSNPTINIKYTYDAGGNRISKQILNSSGNVTYTWYVRDAQGNVMSTYRSVGSGSTLTSYSVDLSEQHLYGSSRTGILNRSVNMKVAFTQEDILTFERGHKQYELSNHLGNVLVTITDKKTGVSTNGTTIDNFIADVSSANDYYPFGMGMPNRKFSTDKYRYGFNGKEVDGETSSTTTYDYGFRIYNPALGKFLSVDPLTKSYPWYTPYQFAGNKPINSIDVDGLEEYSSYEAYKLDKGTAALEAMDGSDGAWLSSDRTAKSSVWSTAMKTITEKGWQDKFRSYYKFGNKIKELNFSFGIVRDYYNWAQGQMDSRGYESQWAKGASYLVDELAANFDGGTLTSLMYSDMGQLLKDLNQHISNYAVGRFGEVFYGNGIIPDTKDGWYAWDKKFVEDEQMTKVAPRVYEAYAGTGALDQLNELVRKDFSVVGIGAHFFGKHFFPDFKKFGTNVNDANSQFGAQDRFDIPLLMLWPMTHNKGGGKLTPAQFNEIWKAHNAINSYYQNSMKK